jgi:hypothetical protein
MHSTRSRAMLVALAVATGAAAPAMAQSMSSDKMMMGPKGTFTGATDHSAGGSFSITGSGKDRKLVFGDDFRADKAPDTYVLLASGAMADAPGSLDLGKLQKDAGAQSYRIPESVNLATYSSVVLWSRGHRMAVGQAPLATGAMDHGTMSSMDHGGMDKGAMMDKPGMARDTGMMKSMAKDSTMKKP